MRKIIVAYPVLFLFAAVGAAHANTWTTGQEITYTQTQWNGGCEFPPCPGTTANTLLTNDFNTVYGPPPSYGELTVGWSGGYTLSFDSASAVVAYIPATGAIGPLNATLLDPTTSSSGSFGADVVTLTLDVDFSSAGFLKGSSGYFFGNLVMTDFPTLPDLDGLTVGQFVGQLDTLLGGGSLSSGYTIAELDPIAIELEGSFTDGTPSTFAQDNLLPPTTAAVPTPEPGTYGLMLIGLGLLGLIVMRKRISRGHQLAS